MSKTTNKFAPEVRERAVRMVFDHERGTPRDGQRWCRSRRRSAALHEWVKKAEVNSGKRAGVPTEVADKVKAPEREFRELRQANEIFRKGVGIFCAGGA